MNISLTDFLAILAALGGWEAIRWVINFVANRKTDKRKEVAAASSMEGDHNRTNIDWLEKRVVERDTKIDKVYAELRDEQSKRLEEIHKRYEVELRLKEMETKRCDVRGCANRQPPSDY